MAIESRILLGVGGCANRFDLGMSRRIMARQHRVDTGGNNSSILDQHRAKGAAFTRPHVFQRQLDSQGQVIVRC
jgi:hypothetical protein